jgi:hypothetical protein
VSGTVNGEATSIQIPEKPPLFGADNLLKKIPKNTASELLKDRFLYGPGGSLGGVFNCGLLMTLLDRLISWLRYLSLCGIIA